MKEKKKFRTESVMMCTLYMEGFKQTVSLQMVVVDLQLTKTEKKNLLHFVACCARIKLNVNDGNRLYIIEFLS